MVKIKLRWFLIQFKNTFIFIQNQEKSYVNLTFNFKIAHPSYIIRTSIIDTTPTLLAPQLSTTFAIIVTMLPT